MAVESKRLMDSVSVFHSAFQFQENAELKKKKRFQKLLVSVGMPTLQVPKAKTEFYLLLLKMPCPLSQAGFTK